MADRTIAVLMADLPELGTLTGRKIATLAGRAPLADDSGKRQGKRHFRGGRAPVRTILFRVADIVRTFNPAIAEYRTRRLASGKPKMVVRIALVGKPIPRAAF